jgi:hypothetical protein
MTASVPLTEQTWQLLNDQGSEERRRVARTINPKTIVGAPFSSSQGKVPIRSGSTRPHLIGKIPATSSGDCPRTMLARYAVLPSPALASGPQVLLLSKLKAPINHAESTLLQVFFLKNLKPFGINTFEKLGGGSPLWLTDCSKKVSTGKSRRKPNFPFSLRTKTYHN